MTYLTLFVWSFLAATIVPLGSEPALIYLVRDARPLPVLVAVATAGNYLGACTTYLLGRAAVRTWRGGPAPTSGRQRGVRLVQRYGRVALLFSWVPLIGDAIVAAAGAAEIPFFRFSIWTIVGKGARYIAVAYAARNW